VVVRRIVRALAGLARPAGTATKNIRISQPTRRVMSSSWTPGPKTIEWRCEAPCTPTQRRHNENIYDVKR
jgi:hypothetical protein